MLKIKQSHFLSKIKIIYAKRKTLFNYLKGIMSERSAVKVACCVLGGERASDRPDLLDLKQFEYETVGTSPGTFNSTSIITRIETQPNKNVLFAREAF